MAKATLLVVGAGGDVGRGIVSAALASGRNVIAVGRDAAKLEKVAEGHPGAALACVAGDLASEASAERLWLAARVPFGQIDAAVVSVNMPVARRSLAEWSADDLAATIAGNVLTHFIAAKCILPRLPDSGMFIGIGGGTADFIFPRMAPISMSQAALRMLYRGLAKERTAGAQLCELMVVSMVAGASNRNTANDEWITDEEVGQHVCAILDAPDRFAQPILHLRSHAQVGHPEPEQHGGQRKA